MPNTTVATGTFPSLKAANQAVQRLVSSGFARNSIELRRHEDDEGFELEVHTRKENLRRVKRLIGSSSPMSSVGDAVSGAAQTAKSHPIILLGAGILAGFAVYSLFTQGWSSSTSSQAKSSRAKSGSRTRRRQPQG